MSHYSMVLAFSGVMVIMAGLLIIGIQMALFYSHSQSEDSRHRGSEGSFKTPLGRIAVRSPYVGLIVVLLGVFLLVVAGML